MITFLIGLSLSLFYLSSIYFPLKLNFLSNKGVKKIIHAIAWGFFVGAIVLGSYKWDIFTAIMYGIILFSGMTSIVVIILPLLKSFKSENP